MEPGKQHKHGPQNCFPIQARGQEGFNRQRAFVGPEITRAKTKASLRLAVECGCVSAAELISPLCSPGMREASTDHLRL